MSSYGLSSDTIELIQGALSKYTKIEKAILYGSRAKGNYRNGSDIDLTLVGEEMTLRELGKLEWEIDDLLLPYKFDISLFHQIGNPSLIEHIQRVGKDFWVRETQGKSTSD
jgi:predicted nucleotidyltransferase